ncbi:MAG: hypothetical protein H6710_17435 [Myxococcales bacterium]|nr:hypothetical protein [Myxococcales bacterium]
MPTLGDLVTSMLTPPQFALVSGDPANFDPQRSKWLCLTDPCSCEKDISTTDLGSLYNFTRAPSLVDRFLRGVGSGRKPGDLQDDALQGHGHELMEAAASTAHDPRTAAPNGLQNGGFTHAVIATRPTLVPAGHGNPRVDDETRPKNAAVHIYLRVNR